MPKAHFGTPSHRYHRPCFSLSSRRAAHPAWQWPSSSSCSLPSWRSSARLRFAWRRLFLPAKQRAVYSPSTPQKVSVHVLLVSPKCRTTNDSVWYFFNGISICLGLGVVDQMFTERFDFSPKEGLPFLGPRGFIGMDLAVEGPVVLMQPQNEQTADICWLLSNFSMISAVWFLSPCFLGGLAFGM